MAVRSVKKKEVPIHTMDDYPTYLRIMVYGHPGSGKTPFAGTSPGKMLILNADGPDGPSSAKVFSGFKGGIWDLLSHDDLDEAYEYLRHGGAEEYDWVWLDSITLLQDLGMDSIMRKLIHDRPNRNLYVPDQAQYLENQNHLATWVRNMIHLPVNIGITAHVMRFEDQDTGVVTYMPAIAGGGKISMTSRISGHMSVVARLYTATRKKEGGDEQLKVLQSAADSKWFAKDRYDALGGKMVDPTMVKVTDLINAAIHPESGSARKRPTKTAPRRRKTA
jgi:phage nucleotide-binding protein